MSLPRLDFPAARLTLALLAALACALLAPAAASATTYTVDSIADESDRALGGACETAAAKCTLRAAVEESNQLTNKDLIVFATFFDGKSGDRISLGSAIAIEAPLSIVAGGTGCDTSAGVPGPCAEVAAGSLVVESDDVTLRGLAVTGAEVGIDVRESTGFAAENDWLGVKLDGGNGSNVEGIAIGPESNGATIGGRLPESRNVFGHNQYAGLDIEGADDAEIEGNYFGVGPDGVSAAANEIDIQISNTSDGLGYAASGNAIGAPVGPGAGTAACDEACNVIANAFYGVDLQGGGGTELPASGPTYVQGNYFGLSASGGQAPAFEVGLFAGAAGAVTVGGPAADAANFFAGGAVGVESAGATDLAIEGNRVGFDPLGGTLLPPAGSGFVLKSRGLDPAVLPRVEGNTVRMQGGHGILVRYQGATIHDNIVSGGVYGIRLSEDSESSGSLVSGNRVSGAGEVGIEVESSHNAVFGNRVSSVDGPGIRVLATLVPLLAPPPLATGNLIGGDSAEAENVLTGNAGAAIALQTMGAVENEVARNRGSGNGGPFIDLVTVDTPPNGGIQSPAISEALQSAASGTAQPGAHVRVFAKASAETGEIEGFLGEATADSAGRWYLAYSSAVAVGATVAATQTSTLHGTSALATARAAVDPPLWPIEGPPDKGKPHQPPSPTPDTRIRKGPKRRSARTTAKFTFSASVAGSGFECRLDRGKFRACRSPKAYRRLKPGKHVFQVRAASPAGLVDATPAELGFTVLG